MNSNDGSYNGVNFIWWLIAGVSLVTVSMTAFLTYLWKIHKVQKHQSNENSTKVPKSRPKGNRVHVDGGDKLSITVSSDSVSTASGDKNRYGDVAPRSKKLVGDQLVNLYYAKEEKPEHKTSLVPSSSAQNLAEPQTQSTKETEEQSTAREDNNSKQIQVNLGKTGNLAFASKASSTDPSNHSCGKDKMDLSVALELEEGSDDSGECKGKNRLFPDRCPACVVEKQTGKIIRAYRRTEILKSSVSDNTALAQAPYDEPTWPPPKDAPEAELKPKTARNLQKWKDTYVPLKRVLFEIQKLKEEELEEAKCTLSDEELNSNSDEDPEERKKKRKKSTIEGGVLKIKPSAREISTKTKHRPKKSHTENRRKSREEVEDEVTSHSTESFVLPPRKQNTVLIRQSSSRVNLKEYIRSQEQKNEELSAKMNEIGRTLHNFQRDIIDTLKNTSTLKNSQSNSDRSYTIEPTEEEIKHERRKNMEMKAAQFQDHLRSRYMSEVSQNKEANHRSTENKWLDKHMGKSHDIGSLKKLNGTTVTRKESSRERYQTDKDFNRDVEISRKHRQTSFSTSMEEQSPRQEQLNRFHELQRENYRSQGRTESSRGRYQMDKDFNRGVETSRKHRQTGFSTSMEDQSPRQEQSNRLPEFQREHYRSQERPESRERYQSEKNGSLKTPGKDRRSLSASMEERSPRRSSRLQELQRANDRSRGRTDSGRSSRNSQAQSMERRKPSMREKIDSRKHTQRDSTFNGLSYTDDLDASYTRITDGRSFSRNSVDDSRSHFHDRRSSKSQHFPKQSRGYSERNQDASGKRDFMEEEPTRDIIRYPISVLPPKYCTETDELNFVTRNNCMDLPLVEDDNRIPDLSFYDRSPSLTHLPAAKNIYKAYPPRATGKHDQYGMEGLHEDKRSSDEDPLHEFGHNVNLHMFQPVQDQLRSSYNKGNELLIVDAIRGQLERLHKKQSTNKK